MEGGTFVANTANKKKLPNVVTSVGKLASVGRQKSTRGEDKPSSGGGGGGAGGGGGGAWVKRKEASRQWKPTWGFWGCETPSVRTYSTYNVSQRR